MVMGIFYSNYRKLVFENNEELVKLPKRDWGILDRMMKYMATFRLSRFELEVIRKDLIGMAGEAQLEGIELPERLGMPEKEFCDRLIENASRQSITERALPAMRNALITVLVFYMLGWLMDGTPTHYGITNQVFSFAGFAVLLTLFDGWFEGRRTYMDKWRKKASGAVGFILWVMLIVFVNNFLFSQPNGYLPGIFSIKFVIMGTGTGIFAISAVLAAAAFFLSNYYYDRCLRRYQWE